MNYHEYLTSIGYECPAAGCEVERFDALDLGAELRRRYLDWLDSAPDGDCPTVELADSLATVMRGQACFVSLPEPHRRLLRIRGEGWVRDADIVGPDHPAAALLANPYARPGSEHPVAVRRGREYELVPPALRLTVATAVTPVFEADA